MRCRRTSELRGCPQAIAAAVYRIVQEAVLALLEVSCEASARLVLRRSRRLVRARLLWESGLASVPALEAPRQLVQVQGGRLEARVRPDGMVEVLFRLPMAVD